MAAWNNGKYKELYMIYRQCCINSILATKQVEYLLEKNQPKKHLVLSANICLFETR